MVGARARLEFVQHEFAHISIESRNSGLVKDSFRVCPAPRSSISVVQL
jgi:hypothetical protein